ncbi:LLM class flavin-dependent oxidoreductase [Streptomyces sp. NPDC018833]|uniref:LLM class flavin-dependent oxidoreductase n=1 Tax=Streptomyces sp. NPDC018833 TaxID=3365053 RepID=UPI0037B0A68B
MADYGRRLEFGYSTEPGRYGEVLESVLLAERLGLDLVGIQDHPYQGRFLDTWTLLSALAARTERIRFFPDVSNLPLRHPPLIAKSAATLDVISGGRFDLGLGAGGAWEAVEAYGGERRTAGEAVSALEEAITVIRLLWSEQRSVRYDGRFYSLRGAHPGPLPVHDMGIWLGALGPRSLELTGRLANGWVPSSPFLPPPRLPEAHARIDDAAEAAARRPQDIRRLYNIDGLIADGLGQGFLVGPVEQWVEELTGLVIDGGMDTFVFFPRGPVDRQLSLFAEEVVPAVRERVARERGACPAASP